MLKLIEAVDLMYHVHLADKRNDSYLWILSGSMLASSFVLLLLDVPLFIILPIIIGQYLIYVVNRPVFTFTVRTIDGALIVHEQLSSFELAKGIYDTLYLNFDRDKYNIEICVKL